MIENLVSSLRLEKSINTIIWVFPIIAGSLCACSPPPGAEVVYSYWVENSSQSKIAFVISESYPDTSVVSMEEEVRFLESGKKVPIDHNEKLPLYFSSLPLDTLIVFFINPDTLSNHSLSEINHEDNFLDKRYVDLKYLDVHDYHVVFD